MINKIRDEHPLIYCMTNDVVTNFTANGLLAIGASPVMSKNPKESAEMAAASNGLLLNMGTLTDAQLEAMWHAGRSANENGVPIVLDPVAVGATAYRTEVARELLKELDLTVVRGNSGEIASLLGVHAEVRGVEGSSDLSNATLAYEASKKLGMIVCVTGEVDAVSDGENTIEVRHGHEWLASVVGTGCLLGAILAAYVSAHGKDKINALARGLADYGIAAERAYEKSKHDGIGTFQQRFLDELSLATTELNEGRINMIYV